MGTNQQLQGDLDPNPNMATPLANMAALAVEGVPTQPGANQGLEVAPGWTTTQGPASCISAMCEGIGAIVWEVGASTTVVGFNRSRGALGHPGGLGRW